MGTGLSRWFREMKSELKKVVWPSGKQLVNNTVVVLVAVLIVGIIVCLFDLWRRRCWIGLLAQAVLSQGQAVWQKTAKWYVVHTYSGYENTVMATIEKTVETRQLQDIIHAGLHPHGNRYRGHGQAARKPMIARFSPAMC